MSEAIFLDAGLREKELAIRGRLFPGTQLLEVTGSLHSVRNGQWCDLYYYCDICVIKSILPGPCMCCQGPVELVEKPLSSR